jgi:hypothetical protein
MADYSQYYAGGGSSRELAQESVGEIQQRQEGINSHQRDMDMQAASYIYAQKMGVPVSDALALIKAKDENIRNQAKFQVQQDTRNLKAQNSYIQAQSELANIAYTDRDALNKLSAIRAKYSPQLAGTENEATWAKSISSLESGVSNYQTTQHYQNLDDPEKQKVITTAKIVAEAEAKAPYASAEQKAKDEATIQKAILQYAVKNDVSVGEATEALYPTTQKAVVPAGKPQAGATAPSMPSNVVTKIPQGSGLQISGGLGTPVMGVSNPPIPQQESSQIIAPIDDTEEAKPVMPPLSQPNPLPSATPQANPTAPQASQQLTKEALRSLAEELGPNATKESLMDFAKQRGYTF